ncbi:MAG: glycosyltransferase family 4 protein [Dysgonamonadaceae bacterium]|jgi:glycosyltransferase involved in cell wall biosynthesis|nr:glycosyltransferase family 4 protein [Dysgonamonadaceae bacterium]
MKVLQINKYFYLKGGAETVFLNTIKLLEEHGHTVIPFCLKSKKNLKSDYESYFVDYPELSESGWLTKIKHTPSFLYNKKAARQLEKVIVAEKPDIAHIHLMFNSFSASILPVLKKYRIPIVMTLHDYRLICPAYSFTDGKGMVCERCIEKKNFLYCIKNRCYNGNLMNSLLLTLDSYVRKYFISPIDYVDEFIFVSSFSQKKHLEVSKGYGKSSILYNFTNIDSETSSKEKYILFLGRISEEKGIPTLIKAMEAFPGLTLNIAGTGPLIEKLKVSSSANVRFIGFKSGSELKEYIKKALFVILPSGCYENGPMVIPESYTLGTPVIGSRIGGIPEYIEEDKTGFLFDSGSVEQLREVIEYALRLPPESYEAMRKNALSSAEKTFSKERYYESLLSLYNKLLQNKKQSEE